MHNRWKALSLILITAGHSVPSATACTTFSVAQGNQVFVGNTLDWMSGHGVVVINARNVAKTALNHLSEEGFRNVLTWTSQYGSVTLNQLGVEFPYGGMNEKGLVVEIMQLNSSIPENARAGDSRSAINEVQWIQWLLDTAASTREALSAIEKVRIMRASAPVHYLICDASGDCATYELIDGKPVIHVADALKVPVLTNDTYADSLKYLAGFDGFGGGRALPSGRGIKGSLDRFVLGAAAWKAASRAPLGSVGISWVRSWLEQVTNPDTRWRTAYDLASRSMSFEHRSTKTVAAKSHQVALDHLDFRCSQLQRVLLMEEGQWSVWSEAANLELARKSAFVPKLFREMMGHYPSRSTRCLD